VVTPTYLKLVNYLSRKFLTTLEDMKKAAVKIHGLGKQTMFCDQGGKAFKAGDIRAIDLIL